MKTFKNVVTKNQEHHFSQSSIDYLRVYNWCMYTGGEKDYLEVMNGLVSWLILNGSQKVRSTMVGNCLDLLNQGYEFTCSYGLPEGVLVLNERRVVLYHVTRGSRER